VTDLKRKDNTLKQEKENGIKGHLVTDKVEQNNFFIMGSTKLLMVKLLAMLIFRVSTQKFSETCLPVKAVG
jgi:hypothetical protein